MSAEGSLRTAESWGGEIDVLGSRDDDFKRERNYLRGDLPRQEKRFI